MARGTRGARYYNGRELLLSGRHIGLEAREDAQKQAKQLRAFGYWARIVKCSTYNYAVFALQNEQSEKKLT